MTSWNTKDLKGKRFGRLLAKNPIIKNGKRLWLCVCDCGNTTHCYTNNLTKKNGTRSCGCLQKEATSKCKSVDLIGRRFGKLIVIKKTRRKNNIAWECKCDCGNKAIIYTSNLTTGNSTTCGCAQISNMTTHGKYKHPCYMHWASMRGRCLRKKSGGYHNYGGRGIKICDEWNDIENFIRDMGSPPGRGYTLERKDPNGNYCKENCEWITKSEQAFNKRDSIWIEGLPLKKWCAVNNIQYGTAIARLKAGMTAEQIKNTPVRIRYGKNQKCCAPNCDNKSKTRNMCNKHYLRWWHKNKDKL